MAVVAEASPLLGRRSSLAVNSSGLVLGKAVQMGTGYAFWVVAARSASVHEVGVAAAAVSAVMLCTQLGLLGSGSAAIVLLGRGAANASAVVSSALGVLGAAAASAAILMALGLGAASGDLGAELRAPLFVVVFVVAAVFGTTIICFDQVSIALGRGHDTLPRYLLGGSMAVGLLAVAATGSGGPVALVILACWAVDTVASCALGWVQARRDLGAWVRPRLVSATTRELLGLGLPNHALTLAERAPALLVPVITAQVASASVTAAWYPAWMMAWFAYTAPVAVGLAQFSEIVRRPDRLRETTLAALRWSLLLGGAIAVVLAAGAQPILSLLGREYAESSVGALRVLAVGLVPYAVIHAYHAACRSTGRLREATIAALLTGTGACSAAALLATSGATTMAMGWVSVFVLGGCWSAVRLVAMTAPAPSSCPTPSPSCP